MNLSDLKGTELSAAITDELKKYGLYFDSRIAA